jgi:hypothetical protein
VDLLEALVRTDTYLSSNSLEMSLGLDVKTGTIRITSPAPLSTAETSAIQAVAAVQVGFAVDSATPSLLHTYGGRKVTASGGGSALCTTGLTVRHTGTGVQGVTTAGHCGNTGLAYYDTSTNNYGLTLYGERYDDDQDAQWMVNTSHAVFAKVYTGFAYISVTSVAPNLSGWVGDYVCHYGITSGYSCGVITDVHFDPGNLCGPTGTSDCFPSWVKAVEPAGPDELRCDYGDSGGPIFNGGVAYGILKGGFNVPACDSIFFMQWNYLSLMSLAVLTE